MTPTPDLRKVLELASDVRWEEIAKGSDFTVIDRMLLLELYTTARAARDAYNYLTEHDAVIERMAMTEDQFGLLEAWIDAKIAFSKMDVKQRGEMLDAMHEKRRIAFGALVGGK